jgi:hypothetical protein
MRDSHPRPASPACRVRGRRRSEEFRFGPPRSRWPPFRPSGRSLAPAPADLVVLREAIRVPVRGAHVLDGADRIDEVERLVVEGSSKRIGSTMKKRSGTAVLRQRRSSAARSTPQLSYPGGPALDHRTDAAADVERHPGMRLLEQRQQVGPGLGGVTLGLAVRVLIGRGVRRRCEHCVVVHHRSVAVDDLRYRTQFHAVPPPRDPGSRTRADRIKSTLPSPRPRPSRIRTETTLRS